MSFNSPITNMKFRGGGRKSFIFVEEKEKTYEYNCQCKVVSANILFKKIP